MDVYELIREAARCRGSYKGLTPVYRNDAAIDDLFQWTMDFANLKTNVEKASTKAIEGSAEAGVDAGPFISMFLKLKASLKTSASATDAVRTGATEDNRLNLLAVAQAALDSDGVVTDDPARLDPPQFFHFQDVFQAFAVDAEDALLAALGEALGTTVAKRWKTDAALFRDTPQFAYATRDPQPMAAILMVPPNEDKRNGGNTDAMYPSGQNRVCFGRFGAVQNGVRFVSTMYYVADGTVSAAPARSA